MNEGDQWLRARPTIDVFFPDKPAGDWRAEVGQGWIAKLWFRSWRESRVATAAIRSEGWESGSLGRKLRVTVADGYDAQRLADFVLERWPDVKKIQLRCD